MLSHINNFILFLLIFLFAGCFSREVYVPPTNKIINSPSMHKATMKPYRVGGKKYYPTRVSVGDTFSGIASWYGSDFHGKKTSNGEIYNMYALTAAHKTLPMNTMLRVTNLNNGRNVVVRVNDRGPFVAGRVVDLSKTAASQINMIGTGTAPVRVEVLGFNATKSTSTSSYVNTQKVYEGGDFMVQIGAFRKKSGARVYQKRYNLTKNRYKTVIRVYTLGGLPIYRVFLQGFHSLDEAVDFVNEGRFSGAFIVRD